MKAWTKSDAAIIGGLWVVMFILTLCFGGCGMNRENARVAIQQGQGLHAMHEVLRAGSGQVTDPEQHELLQDLGTRVRLAHEQSAQLQRHLSIGLDEDELTVDTSMEEARDYFPAYRTKAQVQMARASDETDTKRTLYGLLSWIGKLVDGLTENWFGWSLGLGGGGLLGVAAAWAASRWQKWKKVAFEIARVAQLVEGSSDEDASGIKKDAAAKQVREGNKPLVETALAATRPGGAR